MGSFGATETTTRGQPVSLTAQAPAAARRLETLVARQAASTTAQAAFVTSGAVATRVGATGRVHRARTPLWAAASRPTPAFAQGRAAAIRVVSTTLAITPQTRAPVTARCCVAVTGIGDPRATSTTEQMCGNRATLLSEQRLAQSITLRPLRS